METMDEFMEHTLQDLYSAETQALEAMPRLLEDVTSPQLRQALEMHIRETEQQVKRLEQIAQKLNVDPNGEECVAMQGLIEEAEDTVAEIDDAELRDAVIIGAAQKMEHYEIASYGTARTLARRAGHEEVAQMLEQTLQEEKDADVKLTQIAESGVNQKAVQ